MKTEKSYSEAKNKDTQQIVKNTGKTVKKEDVCYGLLRQITYKMLFGREKTSIHYYIFIAKPNCF